MRVDLEEPRFTQKQVAACTSADMKTLDNYVQHGHLRPSRIDGKRLFSGFQMVETEVIARLASLFHIPPKTGVLIARQVLAEAGPTIERDAGSVTQGSWALQASERVQTTIERHSDGEVTIVKPSEERPASIDLVVPVQLFARMVLQKAATILEAID